MKQYIKWQFIIQFRQKKINIDILDYHIVGYSFGARLGLQIHDYLNSQKKIICLAGHLGLENQPQKMERLKFEKSFISPEL